MSINTFTPVTANKTAGSGNPPIDMNNIANELAALGGQFSVMNAAYSGGADPTGISASDAAIAATVAAALAAKRPVYIPAGTYKFSNTIDWRANGLRVITDGANVVTFLQTSNNIQFLRLAGQGQQIVGGITLKYSSQQTSADTNSIGISLGDDTIGDCFLCDYQDMRVEQAQTGIAIDPSVAVKAGMFSCSFLGATEVFGYSESAVNLNGGNGIGAGGTGFYIENLYTNNDFPGTSQIAAAWPVILRNYSEFGIDVLNIEHCILSAPAFQVAEVGNATIGTLHQEGLQLAGTLGLIGVGTQVGKLLINGYAPRFCTFTGTTNSLVQFTGGSGQDVEINGLNQPASDGGNSTSVALAMVDFGSVTDATVTVTGVDPLGPLYTVEAVNAGAGCLVQVGDVAGFLATPTEYAPGTRATFNTTSTTHAAVSSANVNTGSFQAPASGTVIVDVDVVAGLATSGDHIAFGLAAHGTVTPLVCNEKVFANAAQLTPYRPRFRVTSLTPGSNYNLDLTFSSPDGASLTVYALGQTTVTPAATGGAPVLITVQAV